MPQTFKPFDEMTPQDYADIGLRVGLEIHQQLRTRTKLFCRCPAGRYSCEYDAEILRHMRPTLSELGEYDGTALMEKKTKKHIYYRVHHDTVCTYEFDDTPPFFMAEDALEVALELALLLRLNLVSELHIARKQYLDGSIPAGFQRTTILGVDGWIPFNGRKIGIRQLGLEEDACREVADVGHKRVYLTDRLGMPLVEPVTEPEMRTPQEAAEVAQILRRICRSTGKVRRGYGAARQDVNVSVAGGTRVEIKGVPQIWRIPRLVYNEARRQCSLLRIRDKLKRRGITTETLRYATADVTGMAAKTGYETFQAAVEKGQRVRCITLKGFADILNEPTQEHTLFAKEFSDRIRVIACLTRLPNMVHSDSPIEALDGGLWHRVRKKMKATHDDVCILVWGNEADTRTACDEILIRAREAATGIPNDTRQALDDGTHGFERVLPGAERMYPDTDLPPIAIPPERVERIRQRLPEYPWDREERFRKMGLAEPFIERLGLSPRVGLFTRLVDDLKIKPTHAAVVLTEQLKAFRRAGLPADALPDDVIVEVFQLYAGGRLAREGVPWVLRRVLELTAESDAPPSVGTVLEAMGMSECGDDLVVMRIGAIVDRLDGSSFQSAETMHRYAMGVAMRELTGRVAGRKVAAALTERLGQGIASK